MGDIEYKMPVTLDDFMDTASFDRDFCAFYRAMTGEVYRYGKRETCLQVNIQNGFPVYMSIILVPKGFENGDGALGPDWPGWAKLKNRKPM